MKTNIDYEPIQEIEVSENVWMWHIIYTANNWKTETEVMICDRMMIEIAKECGMHRVDECGITLEFTDSELINLIILFQDADFAPIVEKIHELRRVPSWKKILKAI